MTPRRPARRPSRRQGARRSTLASDVYGRLRALIVALQIAPGTPLTELELCRKLGVSRTPIRSALQRLQREGLAIGQGTSATTRLVVAPLTAADMRQLFLMVGALDGVAARLAAEMPPAKRTPLITRLDHLNDTLRGLLDGGGVQQVASAQQIDTEFHRAYEVAAAGPQLLAELEALHARRERYVRVYTEALVQTHHLRESVAEHEAVIDALRAGDPDLAEARAEMNFRNAIERFDRLVAVLGERGNWY